MIQTLEEEIKNFIEKNDILITIKKDGKFVQVRLEKYIENKTQYEKYFYCISFVDKENFNSITNIESGLERALSEYFEELTNKENFKGNEDEFNNYIDALVEEHMRLYYNNDMKEYIKILLEI